ncbi:P-loop containing nucleoside triphosphate hydrolase protein [Mycena crocata]|nr:P-loop containing nucleoside triphosphate hydrolase protein [Mycena crocata]
MSLWLRRSARKCPARDDLFTTLFHSSASVSWTKRTRTSRLAEDLTPSSSSGSIHVAPKSRGKRRQEDDTPAFIRDSLPHAGAEAPPEQDPHGRNPSFRRRFRTEVRNEEDWDTRTGKWTQSNFGGGSHQGSRMGLREDRPQSYGLAGHDSAEGYRGHSAREAPANDFVEGNSERRFETRHPTGRRSSDHTGASSSFGLRPLGEDRAHPASRFPSRDRSSPSVNDRDAPTYGRRQPVTPTWDRFPPQNDELDESIVEITSSLKNRNQPSPSPPASKPRPEKPKSQPETPPPKRKKLDDMLFESPPLFLGRAGVPIISKSDPATASTTSSYSPSMGFKNDLPTKFTSPPLLPGFIKSLTDMFGGPAAVPTPIQALSLKWVVDPWTAGQENNPQPNDEETGVSTETIEDADYKEFLLASETGSGKSVAYLLPVLQALKMSEVRRAGGETTPPTSKRGLNPRALILAPTHELARQLSSSAKSLLHDVKLRVSCASRPNQPTRTARDQTVANKGKKNSTVSRMKELLSFADDGAMGEFQVKEADLSGASFPVDVIVGTPMKLMEMVRGRGWEREVEFGAGVAATSEAQKRESGENPVSPEDEADSKGKGPKLRRGRDSIPGVGKWRSSPEMGLSEVEWVVVDEADVLFDSDFQETTRMLLADVAKARGHEVPVVPLPVGLLAPAPPMPVPAPTTSRQKEKETKAKEKEQAGGKIVAKKGPSVITPLNYPFNFLVTSATIPNSLSTYLNAYHPRLQRLVSPNLHRLPKTLRTEYVSWTGGNKNADVERRLRKVWASDAADGLGPVQDSLGDMSKVLIFCNKNTKVNDLGQFLEEKGIKTVQLSSKSDTRKRGSNRHLNGFVKTKAPAVNERPNDWSSSWVTESDEPVETTSPAVQDPAKKEEPINDPMNVPHVMITTSLLSRGLDFSPNIKHVFIVDEPRNMIDFLHRAGRTGRAGQNGKVVIFGKLEGRGSQRNKELKKKVRALMAH